MDGLRALSEPLESQIKTLKNTASTLKKPEDVDHDPDVMLTLDSKALRETSYSDLYQIFIIRKKGTDKEKAELLTKFNSATEYLKAFGTDYRTTFQYFMTKFEKYEQDWNTAVNNTSKLRDRMIWAINNTPMTLPTQQALIKVDSVFLDYVNQHGNPLERHMVKQTLIDPLQIACKAANHPIATELLWLTNDAIHANDNINALKSFTRRGVLKLAVRLNRNKKVLSNLLNRYNELQKASRQNRRFWEILFTIFSTSK